MNNTMLLVATETTDETFAFDKHTHQMKSLPGNKVKALFNVYLVKPP